MVPSMEKSPRIMVVIPHRGGKEMLTRCIRSLIDGEYRNLSVIVVDDASEDNSTQNLCLEFPALTLLRNSENLGFAESVNCGIRQALKQGAEYIFLLNNDTVVHKSCLIHLAHAAMESQGEKAVGALGPKILNHDSDSIWSMGEKIDWRRGCWEDMKEDMGKVMDVESLSGCALLLSRDVFDSIGFFDECFFTYGEDIDFNVRLGKARFRILAVPDAVIRHVGGATAGSGETPFKLYYFTRNRIILMKKYGRLRDWIYFVPFFSYHLLRRLLVLYHKKEIRKSKYLFWAISDSLSGRYGKNARVC